MQLFTAFCVYEGLWARLDGARLLTRSISIRAVVVAGHRRWVIEEQGLWHIVPFAGIIGFIKLSIFD